MRYQYYHLIVKKTYPTIFNRSFYLYPQKSHQNLIPKRRELLFRLKVSPFLAQKPHSSGLRLRSSKAKSNRFFSHQKPPIKADKEVDYRAKANSFSNKSSAVKLEAETLIPIIKEEKPKKKAKKPQPTTENIGFLRAYWRKHSYTIKVIGIPFILFIVYGIYRAKKDNKEYEIESALSEPLLEVIALYSIHQVFKERQAEFGQIKVSRAEITISDEDFFLGLPPSHAVAEANVEIQSSKYGIKYGIVEVLLSRSDFNSEIPVWQPGKLKYKFGSEKGSFEIKQRYQTDLRTWVTILQEIGVLNQYEYPARVPQTEDWDKIHTLIQEKSQGVSQADIEKKLLFESLVKKEKEKTKEEPQEINITPKRETRKERTDSLLNYLSGSKEKIAE